MKKFLAVLLALSMAVCTMVSFSVTAMAAGETFIEKDIWYTMDQYTMDTIPQGATVTFTLKIRGDTFQAAEILSDDPSILYAGPTTVDGDTATCSVTAIKEGETALVFRVSGTAKDENGLPVNAVAVGHPATVVPGTGIVPSRFVSLSKRNIECCVNMDTGTSLNLDFFSERDIKSVKLEHGAKEKLEITGFECVDAPSRNGYVGTVLFQYNTPLDKWEQIDDNLIFEAVDGATTSEHIYFVYSETPFFTTEIKEGLGKDIFILGEETDIKIIFKDVANLITDYTVTVTMGPDSSTTTSPSNYLLKIGEIDTSDLKQFSIPVTPVKEGKQHFRVDVSSERGFHIWRSWDIEVKPADFTIPDEPDQPDKPTGPEDPDQPNKPTDPEEPDQPSKPDQPNKPTTPGKVTESPEQAEYTANKAAEAAAVDLVREANAALAAGKELPAKAQSVTTAAGTTVTAVPVKLYGMEASIYLDTMDLLAGGKVGLKASINSGAAEVILPAGFTHTPEPGRFGYPLGFQKDPRGSDLMTELVKGDTAKTETCKLGGNVVLPTTATVTIKTKLEGKINVYYWNDETKKATLIASPTAADGKVTFATKQLGHLILTTGTI
jgi:hypothetical protein